MYHWGILPSLLDMGTGRPPLSVKDRLGFPFQLSATTPLSSPPVSGDALADGKMNWRFQVFFVLLLGKRVGVASPPVEK